MTSELMALQYYYRFEDGLRAAPVDEFDNPTGPPTVEVYLRYFKIIKRTPKGVWLNLGWGRRRFVLDAARKRFACETEQLARDSFVARKLAQVGHLQAKIRNAEQAIHKVHSSRYAGKQQGVAMDPTAGCLGFNFLNKEVDSE